MSDIIALTVQYVELKDNFVHLHSKLLKKFKNTKNIVGCIKINYNNTCSFASCYSTPYNANGENVLNISLSFANTLGVKENDVVTISDVGFLQSLKLIHVTPVSKDDWVILESSVDAIQNSLLNQIQIVYVHMIFSIWLSKSFSLKVHVDQLDMNVNVGKLEQFTEIIVSGNIKLCQNCVSSSININNEVRNSTDNIVPNFWSFSFFKDIFSWEKYTEFSSSLDLKKPNFIPDINLGIFRCISIDKLLLFSYQSDLYEYPYNVFISKRYCENYFKHQENITVSRLTCLQYGCSTETDKDIEKKQKITFINNDNFSKDVYAYLHIIEDTNVFDNALYKLINCYPTIFVSKTLMCLFNKIKNCKVKLELIGHINQLETLTEINITPLKLEDNRSKEIMVEDFKNYLLSYTAAYNKVILNNYCIFVNEKSNDDFLYITFNPANIPYVELSYEQIAKCNFLPVEQKLNVNFECIDQKDDSNFNLLKFSFLKEIIDILKLHLLLKLKITKNYKYAEINDNFILEGDIGSGKSCLVNALFQELDQLQCTIFVKKIECKTLKGKLVVKIKKILESALMECVYCQPAILCLDDLDILFASSKQSPDQQTTGSSVSSYSSRLSHVIRDLVHLYSKHHIAIIVTASKMCDFDPCIFHARGSSLFTRSIRIPPLNQEMRKETLKILLKNKFGTVPNIISDQEYLEKIIQLIEGYCIQDISDLVDRVYFESLKRHMKNCHPEDLGNVNKSDIDEAISNMIPMSLKEIDFLKNSSVSWKNVGGLKSVKQLLTEILIWPSKYPEIFAQCPLKVQSGTLLFGAPGCGKTLLASAVAGESCLNFISVKGPELLSKYVGESEEGVRNIFRKAQSAKPCILFFDEFDSIAPRRGNDITGVTDRVVNQFLTELDGIESVSGVWVLAATSRPDLIDPALLRPGRLGTSVYCSLPNTDDRLHILKILDVLNLCDETDLLDISRNTDGYTGADLKAILYTACMKTSSFRENLTELHSHCDSEFNVSAEALSIEKVSRSCLFEALSESKPSLKNEEVKMYERIYEQFLRNEKYELETSKPQRLMYA